MHSDQTQLAGAPLRYVDIKSRQAEPRYRFNEH